MKPYEALASARELISRALAPLVGPWDRGETIAPGAAAMLRLAMSDDADAVDNAYGAVERDLTTAIMAGELDPTSDAAPAVALASCEAQHARFAQAASQRLAAPDPTASLPEPIRREIRLKRLYSAPYPDSKGRRCMEPVAGSPGPAPGDTAALRRYLREMAEQADERHRAENAPRPGRRLITTGGYSAAGGYHARPGRKRRKKRRK